MPGVTKWILNRVETESPSAPVRVGPSPPAPLSSPPEPSRSRAPAIIAVIVGFVLLLLAGWAAVVKRRTSNLSQLSEAMRTAKVERQDFIRTLRMHGVVEAVESHRVSAPRLAGSNLNALVITRLAPSGASVKKGDLLVEFDRQNEIKNALDKQAEYRDLEEQIKKKRAEEAAARAKDETELKQADDALKTAELEILKNEVISQIDAEKNRETLEEAKANLKQLKETFDLKRSAADASLHLLEIQRDRARNAMLHAQENAEKMSIRAPMDGLVVLNSIWKGGRMAEVQEGDEVRPGVVFMQVVDPRSMQVRVKVNQADVPYLRLGQAARVRLDAYPELVFPGKLEQIAAIGMTSGFSDKVRTFASRVSIEGADPKLMPDLSAAVDLELAGVPNALVAPRDALLMENGQTFVRVKNGSGFEKRAVKTGAMGDLDVVIESGLQAGAVVLRNGSGGRG